MSRLLTERDVAILRLNRSKQEGVQGTKEERDFEPVVLLYLPFTQCRWLLSELDSDDVAFGLADLGMGTPELGYVYLPEGEEFDVQGLRVRRDDRWTARQTLSRYATEARELGYIKR